MKHALKLTEVKVGYRYRIVLPIRIDCWKLDTELYKRDACVYREAEADGAGVGVAKSAACTSMKGTSQLSLAEY